MAGCSATNDTGKPYKLEKINVVQRDLSVIKPTEVMTTKHIKLTHGSKRVKSKTLATYTVRIGEKYSTSIRRWIHDAGYPFIAWSLTTENQTVLDSIATKRINFNTTLNQAISELSKKIDIPLNIMSDAKAKVAGVFDFDGAARITHVSGVSLKDVVRAVSDNYGMRWVDGDGANRSWLAENDYEFGADYYLLTRYDDIESALSTVLDEYPVRSSILESTQQIFVQENL